MKIGIDIRPLQEKKKSGVGEFTYELLAALFRIDANNEYYLFSNAKNLPAPQIPPTGNAKVNHIHKKYSNKILNAKFRFFNRPKIDELIGEKLDAFIFPNINFYALTPGIKKFLVIHDLSFEIFPEFYSGKGRLWHKMIHTKNFCHEADKIIAVSKNTKQDLIDLYKIDSDKTDVIYPGISERIKKPVDLSMKTRIKEKYNLSDDFILYLGNIETRKNIAGLIAAYKKLKKEDAISCDLVIGGASIFAKDKEINKEGGIRYIGYVDDEERPALYSLARAFVFPSFYEGFGFPPLEAFCQGAPVIAANTGSLPEILEDAAILINPYSESELGAAIKEVLRDENLRSRLRENGRRAIEKYSWDKTAKEWLEILRH